MVRKRVKLLAGFIALFAVVTAFFVQREFQHVKALSEYETWQQQRISDLLKEDESWLNLAGLFWLEEGTSTIGAGIENLFVLKEGGAPESLGTFTRIGDEVSFVPAEQVEVTVLGGEQLEGAIKMIDDGVDSGEPTVLAWNNLQWWVIARDGLLGIRVRDLDSEHLKNFAGVQSFTYNADWKIDAQFLPFESPRLFEYPTILGTMREEEAPGVLVFERDGKQFEMIPFERNEGTRLFLVFGDQTNGKKTYEGGRFLYVELPDETGQTQIDFNRSYNPPCAFSPYSTCPQPLRQNRLSFPVKAGEITYKEK